MQRFIECFLCGTVRKVQVGALVQQVFLGGVALFNATSERRAGTKLEAVVTHVTNSGVMIFPALVDE